MSLGALSARFCPYAYLLGGGGGERKGHLPCVISEMREAMRAWCVGWPGAIDDDKDEGLRENRHAPIGEVHGVQTQKAKKKGERREGSESGEDTSVVGTDEGG